MSWWQVWQIVSTPDNTPVVALLFLMPFFVWLGLRQARANDRLIGQLEADPEMRRTHHRKTQPLEPGWAKEVHVWPFLLRMEFLAAIIVTIILMVWALSLNAPLEALANPHVTPNPEKAPWYFMALQEMLYYFDPWFAGVVVPTLIIIGLMAIPFIDTNPLGRGYYTWKQRKFAISAFLFGLFLWMLLMCFGVFIRGPGYMWFWPGQFWDPARVVFTVNRNLPDLFHITSAWGKGIFGAAVLGIYYAVVGYGFFRLMTWNEFNRKIFRRMSLLQIFVMDFLLTTMMLVPVKVIIMHAFRIKYIWMTPWFNI